MKYFVAGTTASTATNLTNIHRNTAVRFFHNLRVKIAQIQHSSKIVSDENYFGGEGKRGRAAASKVAVFWHIKTRQEVYTQIVLDAKKYFNAHCEP